MEANTPNVWTHEGRGDNVLEKDICLPGVGLIDVDDVAQSQGRNTGVEESILGGGKSFNSGSLPVTFFAFKPLRVKRTQNLKLI